MSHIINLASHLALPISEFINMDFQQSLEKYIPISKQHWLPIALGLMGLILLSYGVISSFNPPAGGQEDITFESSESSNDKKAQILVDIQGAVVTPGVYTLNSDARVKDALIAASGLSSGADREWVAKNLNQAAKLTDGAKIYIPRVGDPSASSGQGSGRGEAGSGVVSSNLININSASSSELESLPGIGPVTAGKIIDNRPYTSIEELRSKKVVGQSVFEKIKDKISVY